MAVTRPLYSDIDISEPVSRYLLASWRTAMSDILAHGVRGDIAIDPHDAMKYRYDYYGLLGFLKIPVKYNYPHLLANGLTSPTKYDGTILTMKRLSYQVLDSYHTAFLR